MNDPPITLLPSEPTPPDGSSAFAGRHQEPRLGIIHFMVWTACTAVYFSIYRVLHLMMFPDRAGTFDPTEIVQMSYGLAVGASWGGLLVFVRRRYRRLPFPTHPGELLLLAFGICVLLSLAWSAIFFWIMRALGWDVASMSWSHWVFLEWVDNAMSGLVFLVAALKNKNVRWRPFFVSCVAFYAVMLVEPCLGGSPGGFPVFRCLHFIPGMVLFWIVLKDLFGPDQYPWTHWLGVGVNFYADAVLLAMLLTDILTGSLQW